MSTQLYIAEKSRDVTIRPILYSNGVMHKYPVILSLYRCANFYVRIFVLGSYFDLE